MQISPKASMWLLIVYLILTGVTAPALSAAGIANATQVVAAMSLLAMPIGIVLHAFSSSIPGPLAPPDPPVVVAATKLAALPDDARPSTVDAAKAAVTSAVADH